MNDTRNQTKAACTMGGIVMVSRVYMQVICLNLFLVRGDVSRNTASHTAGSLSPIASSVRHFNPSSLTRISALQFSAGQANRFTSNRQQHSSSLTTPYAHQLNPFTLTQQITTSSSTTRYTEQHRPPGLKNPSTRKSGKHSESGSWTNDPKALIPTAGEKDSGSEDDVCLYEDYGGPFAMLCRCQGSSADCFNSNLSKKERIPSFDRPITELDLEKCQINEIRTSDYFVNVRDVVKLNLRKNKIRYLHPKAFDLLTRLKVLYFGENKLKYGEYHNLSSESMQSVFVLTSLEKLYLSGSTWNAMRPSFSTFGDDSLPNITTMWLDYNDLGDLYLLYFMPLKSLKELNVSSSKVSFIIPGHLPSLERLWASDNAIEEAPRLCAQGKKLYPLLSEIDLRRNKITKMPLYHWCSNLSNNRMLKLDMSHNRIHEIPSGTFWHLPVTHLHLVKALSLDCTIEPGAFSSNILAEIDLSLNGLDLATDAVHDDAFFNCSRLSEMHLSGNSFRFISEEKFYRLTSPLRSLKTLALANTQLDHIGPGMMRGLNNVTEMDLSKNLLRVVPDGTFDDLELLSVLRLDSNLISTVSEKTFSAVMRSRLKSLNLSNNPFECTCSLLWFRHWLQSSPSLFDYPRSPYKCSNMAGVDVATFVMNEQQCLLSHEAYVTIVICFTMLLVTLTLVTVLYRYRWHIRLLLYEAYRGERLAKWHYRRQEDFHYDLFVSYDSEDSRWVLGQLVPVLEQQTGLRLCVHQRDFIPGKNVVDNILDCLQVSKRVLAVFSPNFAQSQWCHFELNLCLSHVVENDDVMVVVMLREVPTRDITGAMAAVMKTTTYIEWVDEPEAVDSFWRRMTLALKDVLPALRQ